MNLTLKFKIIQIYGTQADFAHRIGTNDSLVSRIVRGRRKLDPRNQEKWADALGCKPQELFQAE
jgi:transcriptional regulator with XRE-family HTH domain